MSKNQNHYWGNVTTAVSTLSQGLKLTLKHAWNSRKSRKHLAITDPAYFANQEGIATIQFPHETIPVPDNGRYQLYNEIDDCIVCDKCAKVCPVNCITIEPIKSPAEIGRTSDGTPKRIYAARFDIDMGKCCFCGLCTTVCPTECLTMTKEYDFSVFDIKEHNFEFATMSEQEVAEKKLQWDEHQKSKVAATPPTSPASVPESTTIQPPPIVTGAKPVFRPRVKPPSPPTEPTS
jgi:formate hydrogenlyase subunit 6/NADH:ubiquinone oxidoreductase subunit I